MDTTTIERKKKRSEWAKRYGERLPESALEGQAYEEGQRPDPSSGQSSSPTAGQREYWREDEEQFYNESRRRGSGHGESTTSLRSDNSGGRWTYPANFDEAVIEGGSRRKSKSSKKDRWARTEEAYTSTDGGSKKKKKKKRRPSEEADQLPPLEPEIGSRPEQSVKAKGEAHRDPLEHEF